MEYFSVLMVSLFSFFSTIALIQILRRYAPRLGMVDVPGGRKEHEGAIPVVGGIAFFIAFLASSFLLGVSLDGWHSFFASLMLLVVVGTLDDLRDLTARSRFIVQIIVGLLMASWGGIYFDNLGNLFGTGDIHLDNWAIPFTVFAVIGVINSFNMIDGVDGLAGGLAFIALLIFAMTAWGAGMIVHTSLLVVLASVLLGFLLFNMRSPWRLKAVVFMGDAGSMTLGFALIWFAVDLSDMQSRAISPITTAWILAVPIMDTVSTMLRRMLKGQSPFIADREHLHHIFLRAGYSVSETVTIILLVSLIYSLIGVLGWYYALPEYWMFYGFLFVFAMHFTAMHHAWRFMKILKKANRRRRLLRVFKKSTIVVKE